MVVAEYHGETFLKNCFDAFAAAPDLYERLGREREVPVDHHLLPNDRSEAVGIHVREDLVEYLLDQRFKGVEVGGVDSFVKEVDFVVDFITTEMIDPRVRVEARKKVREKSVKKTSHLGGVQFELAALRLSSKR